MNTRKVRPTNDTIQGTALRLLVLFYRVQTESIPKIRDFLINFKDTDFTKFEIKSYDNKDLFYYSVTHCSNSSSVLYSAFGYLKDKRMLEFTSKKTLDGLITLYNFRVTANGIDTIESGDNKKGGRKKLIDSFNLNLNFTLDLDSIFKISLADLVNSIS